MADEVALHVGGTKYLGWKTARVNVGIETIAGSFELSVSDRWAIRDEVWPIQEEDECQISIAGTVVLTGYVDKCDTSFDADSHTLTISGRDKTGDIVDCSAKLSGWEFKGISLQAFAEKLCAPFGITVTVQDGLKAKAEVTVGKHHTKHTIAPGDTIFHALEQACRLAGVLAISDGHGGLVLTRAGTERVSTSLVEGQNMLAGGSTSDASGRFRTYHVLGSHRGDDEMFGESASAVTGSAEDPNVKRAARVLIVRPERNVTGDLAKKRAQWEAATRAARAKTVTATVRGWTYAAGKIWRPNMLVSVRSKTARVDGTVLISGVSYEVGDSGTLTTLTLSHPEAFNPEPVVPKSNGLWKEISSGV